METEKELVNTLVAMYQTTDTSERNRLYQNLLAFSTDKMVFLGYLLNTLKLDFTAQEKLSVSIFFKTYLNNLIMKKEMSSAERIEIFNEIINSETEVIIHLSQCIESIMYFDLTDDSEGLLVDQLFQHIVNLVKSESQMSDVDKLRLFFTLFKININVIQDSDILSERMKSFSEILISVAGKTIECLKTSFENSNQTDARLFSSLIYEFTMISREAMSKIIKEGKTIEKVDFFTTENYISLVEEIIFFGIPKGGVFFDSGDEQINDRIFQSKTNMIKILSQLITLIKPHINMTNLEGSNFEILLKN